MTFKDLHDIYARAIHYCALSTKLGISSDLTSLMADFVVWEGPVQGKVLDMMHWETMEATTGLVTKSQKGIVSIRSIGYDYRYIEDFNPKSLFLYPYHHLTKTACVSENLFKAGIQDPLQIVAPCYIIRRTKERGEFYPKYFLGEFVVSQSTLPDPRAEQHFWETAEKQDLSVLTIPSRNWECRYCATKKNTMLWCGKCGAVANVFP